MTHSMSSDRQSLLLLSLLQMSIIMKILIFQLSYVLYFVNFIHTIKISNLQFCVVITSSLFWPKNVNYWLCERRGPFSSCIETCMFSYISLLIQSLVLGTFFKILLLSEYRVPSSCIRLTFDYNLFFIYIVEQDTFNGVILKNIHIITDKYNCSQIQAIIQLFYKVVRHTLAL